MYKFASNKNHSSSCFRSSARDSVLSAAGTISLLSGMGVDTVSDDKGVFSASAADRMVDSAAGVLPLALSLAFIDVELELDDEDFFELGGALRLTSFMSAASRARPSLGVRRWSGRGLRTVLQPSGVQRSRQATVHAQQAGPQAHSLLPRCRMPEVRLGCDP